jgi:hypothetical protein
MVSTYFNIGGVEEMGFTTWKRAMNQTLKAQHNVILKPSCGSLKKPTPRKEQSSKLQIKPLAEQKSNQQQPNTNTKPKTGASASPLVVVETRHSHSNF